VPERDQNVEEESQGSGRRGKATGERSKQEDDEFGGDGFEISWMFRENST
jgi:hypothetical protein